MLLERDANTVFPGSFCDAPCGQDMLLQVFVHLERQAGREPVREKDSRCTGVRPGFTPDIGDYRSHVL